MIHKIRPINKLDIERRSKNGNDEEKYDIIIVGAGSAGSLLTYRLAQKYPTAKILVLETGKDDVQDNVVDRTPAKGPNPNDPQDDWGQLIRGIGSLFGEGCESWQQLLRTQTTDPITSSPRIIAMPRGATLGGTSAINASLWNRGTKAGTYDKWAQALEMDPNDPASDFGWHKMTDSYVSIENRSQQTLFYGKAIKYWLSPNTTSVPTGARLNPALHGVQGQIYLNQCLLPGFASHAIEKIIQSGIQPERSFQINLDAEDPTNPPEYHSLVPSANYDQSDPHFSVINPYPLSTPGPTYIPPNSSGIKRGPEFAGPPIKLGGSKLKKSLLARCFAAPAFLYPLIYNRIPNNVTIKTECYVTRLIFDNPSDPLECTGVEYVENGWHVATVDRAIRRDVKPWQGTASEVDRMTCSKAAAVVNQEAAQKNGFKKAYAKADVFLCAGTIDSAAILQRSGIGNRSDLESLNYSPVKCILDLPGVGKSVQDTPDFVVVYHMEVDNNTYLPKSTGIPASAPLTSWPDLFGLADPQDISDPEGSSSIGGASLRIAGDGGRIRIKSDPSKPKFDFDLLSVESGGGFQVGNILWQDFMNFGLSDKSTFRFPITNIAEFNRSETGGYDGNGSVAHMTTALLISEYWDVQSQGEVRITSGNVFDRPNYAPNMLSNENDLEAFENHMMNNIIPICKKMAKKRFGPRGPFSYSSSLGAPNPTKTSLQLAPEPSPFKPFAPEYLISQEEYDKPNSPFMLGAKITINSGESGTVATWSGNTGISETSYIATLVSELTEVPQPGDEYVMASASETPLDSVEFSEDNRRNFVRFANPAGDQIFSDLFVQELPENPFVTTVGSTRITINSPGHHLSEGEIIKISGVADAVDSINSKEFNDYHVVDAVLNSNTFQIILFWNRTARPGTPGAQPYPNPAAHAKGSCGGGIGVKVHTLQFDKLKFRTWLQANYFCGWHASSSCRMGLPNDTHAVVDTRGRVYNTKGLRVCDGSILPTKPDGNSLAPIYGIAQRLFEMISTEEYDHLF